METRPALNSILSSPALPNLTTFLCLRNKQLIQVLGWLWDLSITEEHIFSKAFFYFVCLDIMLYSGKCGLAIYKQLGARYVCWCGAAAVGAEVLRPLGFWLGRPLGQGRGERGQLRGHLEGARIVKDQQGGEFSPEETVGRKLPV